MSAIGLLRNSNGLARLEAHMARSSHEVLENARTIAVVGASRDPNKAGGSVPEGLQRRGFRIIPINPHADMLFGEKVYRSLLDVPEKIDLVDVFRPAADAPEIARQAAKVGAKALWLQLDIRSDEARRIAEAAGIDYVEDECTGVVASLHRIRKTAAQAITLGALARPKRDRSIESELKFRVAGRRDHDKLRAMLQQREAKLVGRYREENFRFNGPGKSTRNTTLRLRVLNGGPRGMLTAKGPAKFDGGVKSREETEIEIHDVHATLDMLDQLGFRVGWTYPKRRTMWLLDGVAVTLDVLDFGWFVELEGPATALPEMARSLGLDPANALKDSYSVMARKHQNKKKPTKSPAVPVVIPPVEEAAKA